MSDLNEQYKKQLIERYVAGHATENELQAFFGMISTAELDALLEAHMDEEIYATRHELAVLPHKKTYKFRIAAAAAMLLFLCTGGYFLLNKQPVSQIAQLKLHDIAPAHSQATLTLANGSKILLTKYLSGKLAQQGNTVINVNTNQDLTYAINGTASRLAKKEIEYNTVTTNRGEELPFPLILGDGTKVWLNAASSITFPVAFIGSERRVTITGEAYFEVVHDDKMPFKVISGDETTEDIGTHFNINSYTDENAVKTTLLEGAVKVWYNGDSKLLTPGQQAVFKSNTLSVANANTEEAIAWKNGYFRFNNEKIESIMRKLSRWYNIDVSYDSKVSDEGYYGTISRFKNISEVLNMLEQTKGVHFKIEGRRVTVIP